MMEKNLAVGEKLIVIGENIHTTRALRRKGPKIVEYNGVEAVAYTDSVGATRHLSIPESFKERQEYQQGQVKHVMIAVSTAMSGSTELEEALIYIKQLVLTLLLIVQGH